MKSIYKEIKQLENPFDPAYAYESEKTEFANTPVGYPIYTRAAIEDYLKRKYLSIYKGEKEESLSFMAIVLGFSMQGTESISWTETPIHETEAHPPIHVLKSVNQAMEDFSKMFVVDVNDVEDRLVIGICVRDSSRYYIDSWKKDEELL